MARMRTPKPINQGKHLEGMNAPRAGIAECVGRDLYQRLGVRLDTAPWFKLSRFYPMPKIPFL